MQYNKTIRISTNKHYLYSLRFSLSPTNREHNSSVIALTRKRVSQSEIQSEEKQKRTLTSACVHVSAPFFNEWYMLMGHRKVCRINSENLLLRCIFFQRLHLFSGRRPSRTVRLAFFRYRLLFTGFNWLYMVQKCIFARKPRALSDCIIQTWNAVPALR